MKSNRKRRNTIALMMAVLAVFFSAVSCNMAPEPEPQIPPEGPKATPSIRGQLAFPEGIGKRDVWITLSSEEVSVCTVKAADDLSFRIGDLEEGVSYDIMMTTVAPQDARGISGTRDASVGYGGWLSGIVATPDEGQDVGKVPLRPLGSIKGTAVFGDRDDNVGIDVRINGTSFGAKTDSDGNFEIINVPEGNYVLRYSYAGYVGQLSGEIVLMSDRPDVRPVVTMPEMMLKKNFGSITGSVVLSGIPDAGTTHVYVDSYEHEFNVAVDVGPDGIFTVPRLEPGTYFVIIGRDGYADASFSSVIVEPSLSTVLGQVILEKKTSGITAKAQDDEGNPIAGCSIQIENVSGSIKTGFTDRDGSFRIMVPEGTYSVKFIRDGYETAIRKDILVPADDYADMGSVMLKKAFGTLFGKVTIPLDADPTVPALVTISAPGLETRTVPVGSDGNYMIENIVPGIYEVSFTREGCRAQSEQLIIKAGIPVESDAALIFDHARVMGRITLEDEMGSFLGIKVEAVLKGTEKTFTAYTDGDGYFDLEGIDTDGTYTVRAFRDGYGTESLGDFELKAGTVVPVNDIMLRSIYYRIDGKVILTGRTTHENATVVLYGSAKTLQTTTDLEGRYHFSGVPDGTYTLSISSIGYESSAIGITIDGYDRYLNDTTLKLGKNSFTGRLSIEGKTEGNYPQIVITATPLSDRTKVYFGISDPEGNFSIAGLDKGKYEITCSAPGYYSVTEKAEMGPDGPLAELSLSLSAFRGEVFGTVRPADGTDPSGITVTVLETGEKYVTDANGYYSFMLTEGNHSGGIRYEKEDYAVKEWHEPISVLFGSSFGIPEQKLIRSNYSLFGRVIGERGSLSGTKVTVTGTELSALTDSDGNFRIDHVPAAGNASSLTFENGTYETLVVDIPDVVGASHDMGTITMKADKCTVYGKVHLEGSENAEGTKAILSSKVSFGPYLKAEANADGTFEFNDVPTAYDYILTITNASWGEKVVDVTGLIPLERINATPEPIVIADGVKPVISAFSMDGGAVSTSRRDIELSLDASDGGSGLEYMRIVINDQYDRTPWIPYQGVTRTMLPEKDGMSTLTLFVKDRAGNISDPSVINVALTQKENILSDSIYEDTVLSDTSRPYLAANDLYIESGATLTLEPGVTLEVAPGKTIHVLGELHSLGTTDSPVTITSSGDEAFGGITSSDGLVLETGRTLYDTSFVRGTILKNTNISKAETIEGNMLITSSAVESDSVRSDGIHDLAVEKSVLTLNRGYIKWSFSNEWKGTGADSQLQLDESFNSTAAGFDRLEISGGAENTLMDNSSCRLEDTDRNCVIGRSGDILELADVQYSNFSGFDGEFVFLPYGHSFSDISMNWWGDANTATLKGNGPESNIPFVHDSKDDPDLGSIEIYPFSEKEFADAGAKGNAFVGGIFSSPMNTKVGDDIPFTISGSGISISEYRTATSRDAIEGAGWKPYSGSESIPYASINPDTDISGRGYYILYLQGRSGDGKTTAIGNLHVPYSAPRLGKDFISPEGKTFSDGERICQDYYNGEIVSAYGGRVSQEFKIDGKPIKSGNSSAENFTNGPHVYELILTDKAGNVSSFTFNVKVQCDVPVVEGSISMPAGPILADGTLVIGVTFSMDNNDHIKTHGVRMNGKTVYIYEDHLYENDYQPYSVNDRFRIPYKYLEIGKDIPVQVFVVDKVGNECVFDAGTITVDPTASDMPVISSDFFDVKERLHTDTTPLVMNFSDNGELSYCEVLLDGRYLSMYDASEEYYKTKTWSCEIPDWDFTGNLDYGIHRLDLKVRDVKGNEVTKSHEFEYVFDESILAGKPSATNLNAVNDGTDLIVSFDLANADKAKYVSLKIDGIYLRADNRYAPGTEKTEKVSFNIPLSELPPGKHELWVETANGEGFRTESIHKEISIEGIPFSGRDTHWRYEGSRLPDSSSLIIFNMNSADMAYDAVSKMNMVPSAWTNGDFVQSYCGRGHIQEIRYFNHPVDIPIPNGEFTLDWWVLIDKNEGNGGSANCGVDALSFTVYNPNDNEDGKVKVSYLDQVSGKYVTDSFPTFGNDSYRIHHYAVTAGRTGYEVYMDGIKIGERTGISIKTGDTITQINLEGSRSSHVDDFRLSEGKRSQDELFAYSSDIWNNWLNRWSFR